MCYMMLHGPCIQFFNNYEVNPACDVLCISRSIVMYLADTLFVWMIAAVGTTDSIYSL
uniref:Uncharacterized protein n=1 Tax=Arundo donax TaxID=35708 RepID=A0A0A9ELM7_ARUDO